MTLPSNLVPRQLRTMADHIGEDAMLKLWAEFGGTHLRIPTLPRIPAGHKLIDVLGGDALKLCDQYGGELLSIPKAHYAQLAIRNKQIRTARRQGQSHAAIAREHNLTERQIINICTAAEMTDLDHGQEKHPDIEGVHGRTTTPETKSHRVAGRSRASSVSSAPFLLKCFFVFSLDYPLNPVGDGATVFFRQG